jgi:hypothetical protein
MPHAAYNGVHIGSYMPTVTQSIINYRTAAKFEQQFPKEV